MFLFFIFLLQKCPLHWNVGVRFCMTESDRLGILARHQNFISKPGRAAAVRLRLLLCLTMCSVTVTRFTADGDPSFGDFVCEALVFTQGKAD
jgi:hypothetical protein